MVRLPKKGAVAPTPTMSSPSLMLLLWLIVAFCLSSLVGTTTALEHPTSHPAIAQAPMKKASMLLQQQQQQQPNPTKLTESSSSSSSSATTTKEYNPFQFYKACMGIVLLWITSGTLFYSFYNDWPLPQSFFYAVDAGMSIGFCTDVAEVRLGSKAFTIVYILLGASVVGGALALFIQDTMEGIIPSYTTTHQYELFLDKHIFRQCNLTTTASSKISLPDFQRLISTLLLLDDGNDVTASTHEQQQQQQQQQDATRTQLSQEDILNLWNALDHIKDAVLFFKEYVGSKQRIAYLVDLLQKKSYSTHLNKGSSSDPAVSTSSSSLSSRMIMILKTCLQWIRKFQHAATKFLHTAFDKEHRIYIAYIAWVFLGVIWGIVDQKWDPITATHFSISALATGGLTGPAVNEDGILPAEPSIFCGVYCLFGIPLMAVTLGHFARVLVSGHIAAMEKSSVTRPLTVTEFEYFSSSMHNDRVQTKKDTSDPALQFADFIVLQLVRQGRINMEMIEDLKSHFDHLDAGQTGTLTLQEATFSSNSNP